MHGTTRWILAVTALLALCVPSASYAQQMNFSYYSDYYYSEDGGTLYTVVDGSDYSTGCSHYNYQSTGYVYAPTGYYSQQGSGLSSYVSVPTSDGNFSFGSNVEVDCSCFGAGLGAGGGSSSGSVWPIPSGESSIQNAWAGSGLDTVFKWRAQLYSNTGATFGGRSVREVDGGNGVDTCYGKYPNYIYPAQTSIHPNSPWTVDGSSQYGDDGIGWIPDAVSFYRGSNGAGYNASPCQFENDQIMQINQEGGRWVRYQTNRIKGGIDPDGVWSYRDGQNVWKAY